MSKFEIVRKHEIHTGHRVYGHQGKCANLHGHSYMFHFHCTSESLNELGMVVDFDEIKLTLCQWLDDNYDHRTLLWEQDPFAEQLIKIDPSIVIVPYNPTAENIAYHILTKIAPQILANTSINLNKVVIEETSKCRASCAL